MEPQAGELIHIPLVVDSARDGFRLDRFLASRIVRLSRTRIQQIVAAGRVRRADTGELLLRPGQRVHTGEALVIERPAPSEPSVVLDYRELHRDPELLVLDKPAGLPVHPSARYHRHTLTALMRERLGGEWTPGLGLTPLCHDPSAGVREAALALAMFAERGGQL